MEELYAEMLKKEMDELIGTMIDTTPSLYQEEEALLNLIRCVHLDHHGYTFKMVDINHDQLIQVLLQLKQIDIPPLLKRIPLNHRDEFTSMGIAHLSGYITFHQSGRFSICIRALPYRIIRKITALLFLY